MGEWVLELWFGWEAQNDFGYLVILGVRGREFFWCTIGRHDYEKKEKRKKKKNSSLVQTGVSMSKKRKEKIREKKGKKNVEQVHPSIH